MNNFSEFRKEIARVGRVLQLLDTEQLRAFLNYEDLSAEEIDVLEAERRASKGLRGERLAQSRREEFFSLLHSLICIQASAAFDQSIKDVVKR